MILEMLGFSSEVTMACNMCQSPYCAYTSCFSCMVCNLDVLIVVIAFGILTMWWCIKDEEAKK